jgi:hypothetical protein
MLKLRLKQSMDSKNQLGPVHFHDFCNTTLTKILKILRLGTMPKP